MSSYQYKCFTCKKEFSSNFIEENFHYLCSDCGKAERNKPLDGVLLIEYDYNSLKKKLKREDFLKLQPGKFWLYPALWLLKFENVSSEYLSRLSLPSDQLLKYEYDGFSLWLMDDTRNPTLSYKDRASSVVAFKAIELGIKEISAASTGNAGSSLAGICARLGIKSHIFVPSSIPDAKRIQIQSFGANIYMVDGSYDEAFDLCLEVSTKKNWYNRNTAFNPFTIEGKKSGAYDIFISSGGNVPDIIFVPVGDGVIISGLLKGFKELFELGWIDKLPKLVAVQAEGSNALERYIITNEFNFIPAKTIADSISASAPRNLYMAADAVRSTGGSVISVSDDEIIVAQKEMAEKIGVLAEPSCSSTFAAYKNIIDRGDLNVEDKILLMITGNGLKDSDVLKQWNYKPSAKSYSEWMDILI